LLAKFLANHSNNAVFRSLYAFAPDNLAWLWAFFDWEASIDMTKVPTHEVFLPFQPKAAAFLSEKEGDFVSASAILIDNATANGSLLKLDDEKLKQINRIFAEAPLVQYKYRGIY
jgi:hypothetical protein